MCWTPLYANKHTSHGTQNVKTHNSTKHKTKQMTTTEPTKKPEVISDIFVIEIYSSEIM